MLYSKLAIPTLREEPANVSSPAHRLMIRAGYMRGRDYLFLGRRVLRKIVSAIREELDAIGAQEFLTAKPRTLGLLAREIRSAKQLPQIWYQFQGLELEGCAFALDREAHQRISGALDRVLERCAVRESPSAITYPAIPDSAGNLEPEEFHTPGQKTIADVAAFTGVPETSQMKTVVVVATTERYGESKLVLALLRGDHHLDEEKLKRFLPAENIRPATPEEIRGAFGADAGSLGPVGLNREGQKKIEIVCDTALCARRNLICGANRNDYHLRNVTPGEDFDAEFADISVESGTDLKRLHCSVTRPHPLMHLEREMERLPSLSRFGVSLDRLLDATIEQNRDADGIALPAGIAPFEVVITPVNISDDAQRAAALEIYNACIARKIDTLCDDRDERPGVKFKDSDLIGIPYRVTIGKKLPQGLVELVTRKGRSTQEVAVENVAESVAQRIASNRK